MSKNLRVVIAQLNLLVGDIQGNLQKHFEAATTARDVLKADVIVFPELSITGYPPEDLLLRPSFIEAANQAVTEFQEKIQNIHCIVGHPHATSQGLFNSCSLIYNGLILARYAKQHLPNYGVFDELRYFTPGNSHTVISIQNIPVGITICEDLWLPSPAQQAANQGARIILSPNASPFEIDKQQQREAVLAKRAKATNTPIVYANCVGGQDDVIFDGGSMVIDAEGKVCQFAGLFNETLLPVDFVVNATNTTASVADFTLPSDDEKIYQCLVTGVRDYVRDNHFTGALIGVSGGIDSALTLAIAVDALGKDKVKALVMPSRYTSDLSVNYAAALIKNLGVTAENLSIEPAYHGLLKTLEPNSDNKTPGITEQNLQSRCRGMLLMARSNQTGHVVLTTGNRSEMAVGYTTLYGDMAGGYAVLKDIPKTLVYRLANYRNQLQSVIPQDIIDRIPTAELAPDQKDEDSLPPYSILDKILECYLDKEQGLEEIVAQGFAQETVQKVIQLIHRSEFKRRQSPVGPRVNHKAFGRDRRYPITSGFNK